MAGPSHVVADAMARSSHDRPVVVGINGSTRSMHLLRLAAHEAELRAVDLRVLHVWSMQSAPGNPPAPGCAQAMSFFCRLANAVRRMQADRAGAGLPTVSVTAQIVDGDITAELVRAAASASLLVLGSGAHRVPSEIVQSISETCIAQSPCPVLLVPSRTVANRALASTVSPPSH